MNKKHLFIGLRAVIVVLLVVASIFAIIFLGKLILPFIIAFFLSLVINPLVQFIQIKTKMPRGFAVLTSILIILTVISAAITLLVTEIIQGFAYLSTIVPEHYKSFTIYVERVFYTNIFPIYEDLLQIFQDLDHTQRSTLLESMQIFGERLTDAFSVVVQAIGNGLYALVKKLPNFATTFIISLLATFFMSKDWEKIVLSVQKNIPGKVRYRINQIYEGLQRALLGFLKAEFKLTFISASIVLVGLLILRVEHALSIALIIWIVDFLPYLGAILVFLPWIIYSFSTGNVILGIGLSVLYGLIVLQRQLIKPKILSSSIGISPLSTIFTMYVGFKLIGIVGIVLGPLTFILLKIFYETEILKDIWMFIKGKPTIERE